MLSILIVEDDITFSLMLTTWLGKKGFVVRSSSSVSDAKRRLGEEAFRTAERRGRKSFAEGAKNSKTS